MEQDHLFERVKKLFRTMERSIDHKSPCLPCLNSISVSELQKWTMFSRMIRSLSSFQNNVGAWNEHLFAVATFQKIKAEISMQL